ncbi:transmembrane protein 179 [Panulirus ornatus]|uniref:transmembrane protein 179 n=1 Tax=Panulirus ornatus TaxID=150431 RepID=UPI003A861767
MGLSNVLVLSQVTTYILALLLALCIIIPISFHLSDFRGHCLLFSNGTWRESDGQFMVSWASQGFCTYNLSWAGVSLLIALIQSYRFISQICRGTESTFLSAFFDVVLSIFMSIAALAGALIITVGYQIWCNAIMLRFEAYLKLDEIRFLLIFSIDLKMEVIPKSKNTSMPKFYSDFNRLFCVANYLLEQVQFGAWTSWVCWVGLSMFSFLKLCKYHQQENIRVSMARERARVVRDRYSPLRD